MNCSRTSKQTTLSDKPWEEDATRNEDFHCWWYWEAHKKGKEPRQYVPISKHQIKKTSLKLKIHANI